MSLDTDALELALTAFATDRTPGRITKTLQSGGRRSLEEARLALDGSVRARVEADARRLHDRGIGVTLFGDKDFPQRLVSRDKPLVPLLFYWGNEALLHEAGIGMCGSRSVSPLGLKAAHACGTEVSTRNLVVVSGYARGVDTATHLAALQAGGRTVIVLAEGIDHFRIKKDFAKDFDSDRAVVVSQFPPTQPWGAYAAMQRNRVIFGLGRALVVIEAGDRGGTLAAGEGALSKGLPLLVLDFGQDTPAGNRVLLAAGGRPVTSTAELAEALGTLSDGDYAKGSVPQSLF